MALNQKCKLKRVLYFIIIIFLLISSSPVQAQDNFPPTITSILTTNQNSFSIDEADLGVVKVQRVQLNTSELGSLVEALDRNPEEIQRIKFDIFENLSFLAVINKKENTLEGGFILSGYLENSLEGRISIVSTNGIISAILTDYTKQYQLKLNRSGQYQFEEIDQSAFPNEMEPIIPLNPVLDQKYFYSETTELDSGATIDLMVVYTDDARLTAGGTTNMVNLINLAVSETNTGYERSNIIQRMNLVHTAEVSYADDSSFNWNTALNNLTNTDNVIDEVRTWRDTYGADLVVMIVNNTAYCGIGWLMTPSYTYDSVGFSVVSRACATGYYSLAHETGHNMGAHHDRATAGSSTAMYSYSYGYQAPNFAFRTIMAYNCTTYCPRINNWSNPDVLYGGLPTGVNYLAPNSADNRMTLNNTAGIVANFRQSRTIPIAPNSLVLTSRNMTSIGLQFSDNSINETGFKIERSINGGTWMQINTLLANQTSYLDTELTCNMNYAYRVRAYNLYGDSSYSNTLTSSTTLCVPPPLPANIQTIISLSSIVMNWDDVENETNYIVEESIDDAKSWTILAVLDENATTFSVSGLLPGTTYSIRLSVENDYGTSTSEPMVLTTMTHAVFMPMLKK